MKKITSIALILLMSVQCFYKLGVITYFHLNREYIAEVLCINKDKPIATCHGQCFLNKNLDVAKETSTDDETLPVAKQKFDLPIFLISKSEYRFANLKSSESNCPYIRDLSSKHSSAPFRPPTV